MSIYADASDMAIAAVLQIKQSGVWCPVAFFSRRFDEAQQKYSTFDRELLVAYSAIKPFRSHCLPTTNLWFVPFRALDPENLPVELAISATLLNTRTIFVTWLVP